MSITGKGKNSDRPNSCQRFCRKMKINENLIMLKITLFVMYGATSSLVPFLTIHMQSVGLTLEEIAVIYLALPLTTFLAPPVTGFLVDKFGHYKPVLFVSLALNAVFHHSLILIPQMETPGEVPPAYVMRDPNNGKVEVWWSPCTSRECPEREELNLVLDKCEDHCLLRSGSIARKKFTKVESSIAVRPPTKVGSPYDTYSAGCYGIWPETPEPPSNTVSTTTVNPDLHFIVEKKHKNSTTKIFGSKFEPAVGRKRNNTAILPPPIINKSEDDSVFMVLDMHENLMTPTENLGMELPEPEDSSEMNDFRQHFREDMLIAAGVNFSDLLEEDLRCGGRVVATNLTYSKLNQLAADCMLQKCVFRAGGPEVCPPDYKESDDRVFWYYFILRFVGTTMMSASVTVMDPIALTLIQEYGGEFGRERLFSTIGMAIFSPVTGLLIDYKSSKQGYTDFSYAFYMYDFLLAISVITVLWMPVGAKMPVDHLMRDMLKLLSLPHIIAFILFMFALGNCWGFIESYLFLHLRELGASNYLLGITVSVATVSSIPFLYGAEKITGYLGHVNVIVLAFFSHAIRLVGYSYIDDPWWVFPFEAMEAIAVHLMWVAAATYCAIIAPKNLLATLIGVLGMAHFSLGRGSGSFIGGFLIGNFGTRQSFRIMGFLGFITGLVYSILYCSYLRKYDYKTDEKEISNTEVASENEKLQQQENVEKGCTSAEKDSEDKGERLSLIIKFNHRGSLTSLDRMYNINKSRRNSSNIELNSSRGSSFTTSQNKINNEDKVTTTKSDLLKSAFELNNAYRKSFPAVSAANYKMSAPQLNKVYNKEYNEGNLSTNQSNHRSSKTLPITASMVLSEELRARSGSIPEEEELNEDKKEPYKKLNVNLQKMNS